MYTQLENALANKRIRQTGTMKNKIAMVCVILASVCFSTAEIVINEFLSFEGFVDMSYTHANGETRQSGDRLDHSHGSLAVDQVEMSCLLDFNPVSAQIDLNYEGGDADTVIFLEQAFATYDLDYGAAITAGRFASMLGFEAFEPTGLYQYSFAYDLPLPDAGGGSASDFTIIPNYAQGVQFTYEADTTFWGISLQDEVFHHDRDHLGHDEQSSWGVEAAFAYYIKGVSWFIGGAYEDADGAEGDSYMLNTYVTFETGAWIFAGELNYGESEANVLASAGVFSTNLDSEEDAFQALIMANFAFSDQSSVTTRISYVDHELSAIDATVSWEFVKFTLAHNYAFTDNLTLVNEISYLDGEVESGGDASIHEASHLFATELTFSF